MSKIRHPNHRNSVYTMDMQFLVMQWEAIYKENHATNIGNTEYIRVHANKKNRKQNQ